MNFDVTPFSSPASATDAIALQKELAQRVRIENDFGVSRIIAGIDVSYDIAADLTKAFVVLLDYTSLTILSSAQAVLKTSFPYVPGLLSFREIPAILEALQKLDRMPDLLMVDGQGIAHPRRLGIAAHLGVITDMPSVGVAKSRLVGHFAALGETRGSIVSLMDRGEKIGTVLRSKEKCNPLFVSPGHRVDQEMALGITLHCLRTYRLPEPTRIADKFSKEKAEDKEKAAGYRRLL